MNNADLQNKDKDNELYLSSLCIDDEIVKLQNVYCGHTGKFIRQISFAEIAELIKIHGLEHAFLVLKMTKKEYSKHWILQNSEALDNLYQHVPDEYLIFALGFIRDLNFENKIACYADLQKLKEKEQNFIALIQPIAEICKRILALDKCKATSLKKWQHEDICKYFANVGELGKLQMELDYYLINLQKKHDEKLQMIGIDADGFMNFRKQKLFKPLSKLEKEIHDDLLNFEVIPNKRAEAVTAIVGERKLTMNLQPKFVQPEKQKQRFTGNFAGGFTVKQTNEGEK